MRLPLRAPERRDALASFSVLWLLIGSHTLLETARDALCLASIEAERRPLVTLAISGLGARLAQERPRLAGGLSRRADPRRPQELRFRLPDAIAAAPPPEVADEVLLGRFDALEAGPVRRRAVEAPRGPRRRHPELALDAEALDRAIEHALGRPIRSSPRFARVDDAAPAPVSEGR